MKSSPSVRMIERAASAVSCRGQACPSEGAEGHPDLDEAGEDRFGRLNGFLTSGVLRTLARGPDNKRRVEEMGLRRKPLRGSRATVDVQNPLVGPETGGKDG